MIRKIVTFGLCLLVLCGSAGCKKHTIIPDEELALIFHDAFLANSYLKNSNPKRDSLLVYEPIFARYGYTTEDVQYTIGNFSKRKSARLGDVVELAITMLEREGERLDKAVADLDTVNNVARRFSERIIHHDSLIRVTRLKDTTLLLFEFDSIRPGDYRITTRYRIDSLDENSGLRFYFQMEKYDSTTTGVQSIALRREEMEEITRLMKADTSIRRLKLSFWHPSRSSERKRPHITLHDLKIYYKMPAEEALDTLYQHHLNIRIFANDFLRQIEADSLTLPADSAGMAEKSTR